MFISIRRNEGEERKGDGKTACAALPQTAVERNETPPRWYLAFLMPDEDLEILRFVET